MKKRIHMVVDVRGVLRWPNSKLAGMFVREDGRSLSGPDAREYLLDQLEVGHRVLPIGKPCEGFSYQTGCPGHAMAEEMEDTVGETVPA